MLEILTPTGFKPFAGITMKIADAVDYKGTTCSLDHRFKINGTFIEANKLDVVPAKEQHLYDIVNVKDHEYITDDKISHNCTEFVGSTDTLIDPSVLMALTGIEPLRKSEDIAIFKEPEENHKYILVADTARGVGGDYSAFIVFDVTKPPFEVVAQYRDNTVKAESYPNYIAHAAKVYNDALVLAEDNDIGAQIISILLYDLEVDNILQTGNAGRAGVQLEKGNNLKPGIKTTAAVKRIGCFTMKSLVENNQIVLNSLDLIDELYSFIKSGKSWEAEEGRHDDLVMCLALFSWMTNQETFLQLVDSEKEDGDAWEKIRQQQKEMMQEQQDLIGIYDPGNEPEVKPEPFVPAYTDVVSNAIDHATVDNGRW